jgi:lamin tail-like protein/type IX secretion system substrate protein
MKKKYTLILGMISLVFSILLSTNDVNAQLYINEFMASNDDAVPGPQNDYPDWIEIYNAGTEAVMLGGYYMSDDLVDPEKMFQIPSTYPDSVTVAAGGFIVLYANKDEASSVLNMDFKLSGGGESIGLWDTEQNFLDSLTYGEQMSDTSYGRYLDGASTWYFMTDYTPGAANVYTTAISDIIVLASVEQNYPNPFTNKTTIEFDLERADNVKIEVFNMSGALISVLADEAFTVGNHKISWNASGLPAGCYFYSIKTTNQRLIRKASKLN